MAARRPLVLVDGLRKELPVGDTILGAPDGSGGLSIVEVASNVTLTENAIHNVTGTRNVSIPASVAAGKQFVVHSVDATTTILRNANTITFKGVSIADDLTVAAGETAWLVSRASNQVEVI